MLRLSLRMQYNLCSSVTQVHDRKGECGAPLSHKLPGGGGGGGAIAQK